MFRGPGSLSTYPRGVRGNLLRTKRFPVRGAAQLVPHNVLALVGAANATTYLFLACYPITRIYCPRGMTVPPSGERYAF